MRSFFKIFFASFLALVVFVLIIFFFTVGYISSVASKPSMMKRAAMPCWCWI